MTVISDHPVVKGRRGMSQMNMAESGLAFRIQTILESDYFLPSDVEFGTISHGLPALAEKQQERVRITLNPDGQTVKLLLGLYDSEFTAFGSMAKAGGPFKPGFGLSGDFAIGPIARIGKKLLVPTQRKPRCVGHPPDRSN